MAVLDFLDPKFTVKLKKTDSFITEFKFLSAFEPARNDNTDTIPTSTGDVQVGDSSTGAEIKIEGIELPDTLLHAKRQHRVRIQGRKGFYEAKFTGKTKLKNGETVNVVWLMRNGTFTADASWSPTDKLKRSATLKVSEIIETVGGYPGTGAY